MSLVDHHNYHPSRLAFKVISACGDATLINAQFPSFVRQMTTVIKSIPRSESRDYIQAQQFVNARLVTDEEFWVVFVSIIGIAHCLDNNLIDGKNKEDAINEASIHIQGLLGEQYGMRKLVETKNYEHTKTNVNPILTKMIFGYIDDFVEDIGE